jgi:RNA polymerase-binding transcription factor DksA
MRSRLRDDIQASIDTVIEQIQPPGEHERAPSEGIDRELVLEKGQEDIVHAINQALERIEKGAYASCQECGSPIAAERLDAMPYVRYCIDCERRLESSA